MEMMRFIQIVLPSMIQRNKGAIINTTSSQCSNSSFFSIDNAKREFIKHLTESLKKQYSPMSRICFQCLLVPVNLDFAPINQIGSLKIQDVDYNNKRLYVETAIKTLGYSNTTTSGHWFYGLKVTIKTWVGWGG
jgi:hypothetical protein